MLRSFRVENHRSIRSEQELSLVPVYRKARQVVPVAAIFGANASGKSNLIDALQFMRSAVRTSFGQWEPGSGVPRVPFLMNVATDSVPASGYAVDLLLDGVGYTYGFDIDDDRVIDEWLWSYPHRRKRVIFEREGSNVVFGSTVSVTRTVGEAIAGMTRDNALFLSTAAHSGHPDVLPVYAWFSRGIEYFESGYAPVDQVLAERLLPDRPDRARIVEMLRAADLGLIDVRVDAVGGEYRVLFLHGDQGFPLAEQLESKGTIAWLRLVVAALDALKLGHVLVVDEVDEGLHARLVPRLLELFQNDRTNPGHAQLIFATHDVSLLGTSFGRDILARDEIFFVEKDEEGATTLFALTDFHPRKDENTGRRYIGGSYGAVPSVFSDTLVERLLSAGELDGAAA